MLGDETFLNKKRDYKDIEEVNYNDDEIDNEFSNVMKKNDINSLELLLKNVNDREEKLKQLLEDNKDNSFFFINIIK